MFEGVFVTLLYIVSYFARMSAVRLFAPHLLRKKSLSFICDLAYSFLVK